MARRNWGEGTIYYDKVRDRYRWAGYYKTIDGQRKRKVIASRDKKYLMLEIDAWMARLDHGCLIPNKDITLDAWCTDWLNMIKPTVKAATYTYYESLTRNYIKPKLGYKLLKNLTTMDIQLFLNSLVGHQGIKEDHVLSARSVNKIRSTLRAILNAAVDNGNMHVNPVRRTKRLQGQDRKIVALNEDQLKRLLDVASHGEYIYIDIKQHYKEDDGMKYLREEYYAAIYLAATTGMRKGEVFGLMWSDVNLDKNILTVSHNLVGTNKVDTPKTKSSNRNIILTQNTVNVLKDWKQKQERFAVEFGPTVFKNKFGFVFTNTRGNSISVDNFLHRYWYKLCKAANLPDGFTFHGLRHTHATCLLQSGVNVKVVSERLGHSDVSMTMRVYAHALPSMQAEAVKALEKHKL